MEYEILKVPGINVTARLDDGVMRVGVKGGLTKFFNTRIQKIADHINNEKPAAVFDDKFYYSLYVPPIPSKAFKRVMKARVIKNVMRRFIPEAATLAITQRCPCKCIHCSAYGRDRSKELPTAVWKKIIDDLLAMGCYNVTFTGGEPTLREDLYELIKHVDKEKAITQMFTTGYFLDKKMAKKLKDAGLQAVQISIDSPDPKEHNKLRGIPGLFDKAMDAIKNAKEAGLLVGISTYATHENLNNGKLLKLINLAGEWGVNEVTVFDAVPTGRFIDRGIMLTPNDNKKLITMHHQLNSRKKGSRVSIMAYVKGPDAAGCISGRTYVHVTAAGEVCPCDFTPLSFGNVTKENIKKVWGRIRKHPEYKCERLTCQMQVPDFRKRYIEKIPDGVEMPYPINTLDRHCSQIGGFK